MQLRIETHGRSRRAQRANRGRTRRINAGVIPALRSSITCEVLMRRGDSSDFDGEADFVGDGFYFSGRQCAHAVCEADEE